MGRILLCHGKKADKPYYIKSINMNLYTLEELCYFFYDNLNWIDESIINDELTKWIIEELSLNELKDSLEANRGNIKNYIMLILRFADYISQADMDKANEILGELETQSDFDKTMARAWHFLGCKLYVDAILEYKKLLDVKEKEHLEKVYNNMGVAYAGLFMYKEAAGCFKKAYEVNCNDSIYKQFLYALAMASDEEIVEFQGDLPSDYKEVFKKDLQSALKDHENRKLSQLEEVLTYKSKNQIGEYYKGLDCLLNDWKKEYINYTG